MDIAPLIIIATFGMLLLVVFMILIVVMYQRNMLQKNQEIKIIEQKKQLELFDASAQAEEREKERIARNLHDEINPMLTVLRQNLQKHKFDILKNKFDVEHFEKDYLLIDKITEGITASSYELVPSFMLKYGLIDSLEDYIRILNEAGNLKAMFKKEDSLADHLLSKSEQLNIYRMCLEIINNLIKHSSCNNLNLSIVITQSKLAIEINHNGKGIDNLEIEEFVKQSKGLGLKSLKARALILNAEVNYIKNVNNPQVLVTVPFTK